jgi:predicted ATPase
VRTISDIERGQRASAHMETIRLLADALSLSDDERRAFIESAHPQTPRSGPGTGPSFGAKRFAGNLPSPATPLIGRSQELGELLAMLQEPPKTVVTLTGPGGVGKTRLAIEAAHHLAPSFADGAAFAGLTTVTQVHLVPDAIARALGMSPPDVIGVDQLIATLASRELLLVVDNLEQVIEAAPILAQVDAACPQVTILVTSRVRLRISSERAITVPPLTLAEQRASFEQHRASGAHQLFVERARSIDTDFVLSDQNTAEVSAICRRLDGFPLAIELAASRLRILSLPDLLERLDSRLPLLTGGDRDLPLHKQSMRGTIDWSYGLLLPDEQRFFRWMSAFVGGLSLESAEALGRAMGLEPIDALEVMTALVESGLVRRLHTPRGAVRFTLFETIREFGLEQLEQTGELETAQRFHAEHFLDFAGREAPRTDELVNISWVARLSAEHPNLMQAFDTLCTPETADQGLRFAAALGGYWQINGPYSEAKPRLSRALALSSTEPSVPRMHTLHWMSWVLGISHDIQGTMLAADECLAIAEQIGTASDRAGALQALAWVQEDHELVDVARTRLEEALELWASVGNSTMQAACLMLHGGLEYLAGNLERAKREVRQARDGFHAIGDVGWSAGANLYEGFIAMAEGRLDLAAICYQQSLRDWIQSGSSARWFKPLIGLADVAAGAGEFEVAARLLGATDELLAVTGRVVMPFDKPGYARAIARCTEMLEPSDFDALRVAGRQMTPDDWLEATIAIVEAAASFATTPK